MLVRRVIGNSMAPGLLPGAIVIGTRTSIKKGDVVVACQKGREVIKRVEDIKEDSFFLVGDNKVESSDSRIYGWVDKSDILAVMKLSLPAATDAHKPETQQLLILSLFAAAVMMGFSLLHLFRIDTFLPALIIALSINESVAGVIGVLLLIAEVFAVPYLLNMRLSPLARFVSGCLVVLVPLSWMLISFWNYGLNIPTAQLGEFQPVYSNALTIILNGFWLALDVFLLRQLGFDWPARLRKPL